MKVAIVLLACLAYAAASGYSHQQGFRHVGNGVAAPYRNADRQRAVNQVAKKVGSGTGTAKYYDVPGTDGLYHGAGYGYGAPYGAGYGYGAPYGAGYGYGAPYGAGYGGYGYGAPFGFAHGRHY